MTLTVNVLGALYEGVGQQLAADADPGLNIAYLAAGTYPAGKVGIFPRTPTSPDTVIVLSPRQITAHPTLADAEYGLNVQLRGTPDPRTVWALRDGIRNVITGRWPTTLPNGLEISCIEFGGGNPLPEDTENRSRWADNYVYRLGEHRARPF